jgi:hypothetical protein
MLDSFCCDRILNIRFSVLESNFQDIRQKKKILIIVKQLTMIFLRMKNLFCEHSKFIHASHSVPFLYRLLYEDVAFAETAS